MPDYKAIQAEVTEYVRAYILALRTLKPRPSFEKIAEMLECSKPWPQQLINQEGYGNRRVGPETEQALANRHHGGSIDALRAAAANLAAGGTVVLEESGQRLLLTRPDARAPLARREVP